MQQNSSRRSTEEQHVIHFSVDGRICTAYPGDTLAAALYAAGMRAWHRARPGDSRGLLCGMGICFDCLVTVDGQPNVRACQALVHEGMRIETGLEQAGQL